MSSTETLIEEYLSESSQGVRAGFWQDAVTDWLRDEFMSAVVSSLPRGPLTGWRAKSAKAIGTTVEGEIVGPRDSRVGFVVSMKEHVSRSVAMWIYDSLGNERKVELSQRSSAKDVAAQITAYFESMK